MMEVVASNYLPGDQRLVDKIVYELKSQGIFDQFRKECFADVDTKPAYQNLRQRVEGNVASFLKDQRWKPDMNKNQVREMLRKSISESGFLETGVERIVDQVVNPKINTVFLPKVEEIVYSYLGIHKPSKEADADDASKTGLLPTDLEAVSPESKGDKSNDNLQEDDSKMEEDESPPFEPLDEQTYVAQEENSVDSHLSGFSGLISHESNQSNDAKVSQIDFTQQDSQSRNSSDSRLSIVTSDDNSKMDICDESQGKLLKTIELNSKNCDRDKNVDKKTDDRKSEKARDSDKYKSKTDRRDDKGTDRKSKDSKSRHGSSSSSRDKDKSRDRKDSRSSSKSEKNPDRDRKMSSSSSSKHSSNRDKDKGTKKDSSKDKERSDKDKNRSTSHKDSKSKDSKHKSSSSDRDKYKKDDKYHHSSNKKDKDKKKDSKSKSKDDHYSSKEKKNERRSTDRDSNDGSSKQSFSSSNENSSSQSQRNGQTNITTQGGNGDAGNCDQGKTVKASIFPVNNSIRNSNVPLVNDKVKLNKPKFASNIHEAMRLMKIRKQLARLEKKNQLSLASVDVDKSMLISSSINLDEIRKNGLIDDQPNPVTSQDNWDAMEAKLQEEINDCRYFSAVDLEKNEFLQFIGKFIDRISGNVRLGNQLKINNKRKLEEVTEEKNNNKSNALVKKRKPTVRNSMSKKTKEKCNTGTDVLTNDNFPLPLSPAESDKSNDKREEPVLNPVKPKRNNANKAANQRYSSDDLYKPRSTFASRRRGAKILEN